VGKRIRYGRLLNVRGIQHEPQNEQGVVALFAALAEELGYGILHIQNQFPDVELRRELPDGRWERLRGEFELQSSNFADHGHSIDECDLVICWQHDWRLCPIEVLDLSREIAKFRAKGLVPGKVSDTQRSLLTAPNPPRTSVRKKPDIVYPDGFQPIPEAASRLARLLGTKEQNVYAQLWRRRCRLPLKRDASGEIEERGPRGAYLLPVLDDEELVKVWESLSPRQAPTKDDAHLSGTRAAHALGFRTRSGLNRKIRARDSGWLPDCLQHRNCYTPARIESITQQFELCSADEQLELLSTTELREVFAELGIAKDRHAVTKYTKQGQLKYYGKAPGQVRGGLQYYYHPDEIVVFLRHNFGREPSSVRAAIRKIKLRAEPLGRSAGS
jgi:hypothetical protein